MGNNVFAISGLVVKELYRRKDFYVLFILVVLITLAMGSVNFFNDDRIVRYLKELCLAAIWISSVVIAILTASRQIPAEQESRTIFPLLAKPVSRTEVVLGKFLGCLMASGIALLLFYLFFMLAVVSREKTWYLVNYFQAITLHWFGLGVIIAFTLAGSMVAAAVSSNATICFLAASGILLLGRHLNKVAIGLDEPQQSLLYGIYYVIPHLEFFDVRSLITHNWAAIDWLVWLGALLYGAVYMAIFLWIAVILFRRKSFT